MKLWKPKARGESFGNHEVESYSGSSHWLFLMLDVDKLTIASHHRRTVHDAHLKFGLLNCSFPIGSCMLLLFAQLELTKSSVNLLPSRSGARIDPAAVCSMSRAGFVVQLGVAPEACVAKGMNANMCRMHSDEFVSSSTIEVLSICRQRKHPNHSCTCLCLCLYYMCWIYVCFCKTTCIRCIVWAFMGLLEFVLTCTLDRRLDRWVQTKTPWYADVFCLHWHLFDN